MYRIVAVVGWLFASLIAGDTQGQVEEETSLAFATGAAGTDSFVFAVELWAVSETASLTKNGVRLQTVQIDAASERLRRLEKGEVGFALVPRAEPATFALPLRAVMALWPQGVVEPGAEPMQLLVHNSVPEAAVYGMTRTIFEQAGKLLGAHATIGVGAPEAAVSGLSMPIHPGAERYYDERGVSLDQERVSTARRPDVAKPLDALDYAGLDDDERLQLIAACRDAHQRGALVHFESDELAGACHPRGVIDIWGGGYGPVHGQGGPELRLSDDDELRRLGAQPSRQDGPKKRFRQPTM